VAATVRTFGGLVINVIAFGGFHAVELARYTFLVGFMTAFALHVLYRDLLADFGHIYGLCLEYIQPRSYLGTALRALALRVALLELHAIGHAVR